MEEVEIFIAKTWQSLLAVACCSAPTWGQAAVTIESEKYTLSPGESTVVTMHALFPHSEFAFAAIITDLVSSTGSTGWSDFEIPRTLRAPGSTSGTPTGMGIEEIIAGQVYFPPAGPWPDLSNPILFWQGTYTAPSDVAVPFDLSLSTRTRRFETYFSIDEFGTRSHVDGLIEGEATIQVVPAPASIVFFCVAGLAIGRRRR